MTHYLKKRNRILSDISAINLDISTKYSELQSLTGKDLISELNETAFNIKFENDKDEDLKNYKDNTEREETEGKNFDAGDRDELFETAAKLIVQNQIGSTSLLQRRMKLGYNRAGRLMDQLEAAGIVGKNLGSKAREVNVKTESELSEILQSMI